MIMNVTFIFYYTISFYYFSVWCCDYLVISFLYFCMHLWELLSVSLYNLEIHCILIFKLLESSPSVCHPHRR